MGPQPQQPFIDITPEASESGSYGSGRYSALDRVLRRRRIVFFSVLILLTGIAVLWLLLQPKSYLATARVILTRLGASARPVSDGEIASEIELAWSQIDGLYAASRTGMAESVQTADARRELMRSKTEIRRAGKSNVIEIACQDPSASIASEAANQLMELYLRQRSLLLASPLHTVGIEAQAMVLQAQAEEAEKELAKFDAQHTALGADAGFRTEARRLQTLGDRVSELRATVRGQEEMLRVLVRQQSSGRSAGGNGASQPETVLRAEAELAGLRAKLQEVEREYARAQKEESAVGALAVERERIVRRLAVLRERSTFLSHRMDESHLAGMNLQARILMHAEVTPVRTLDLTWWQLLALGLSILLTAWVAAWAADLFDRPVYSDDEFARMTGAPKMHTATR